MALSAETAVKKLARQAENCICPNCGTYSKYGFNTVCIKYLTFVCNLCKTAHQAVSHRCKSLTMSSWDQGEVLKLKKNGNEVARNTWLAGAPQPGVGGRPKEGDDVNIFKRFVVTVYEEKKYIEKHENVEKVVQDGKFGGNHDDDADAVLLGSVPVTAAKTNAISSCNVGNVVPTMDLLDLMVVDDGHAKSFGDFSSSKGGSSSTTAVSTTGTSTGSSSACSNVSNTNTQSFYCRNDDFGDSADFSSSQSQVHYLKPTMDLFDAAPTNRGSDDYNNLEEKTTCHQQGNNGNNSKEEEDWGDFADFSQVPSKDLTTQSNTRDVFGVQQPCNAPGPQEDFADFANFTHFKNNNNNSNNNVSDFNFTSGHALSDAHKTNAVIDSFDWLSNDKTSNLVGNNQNAVSNTNASLMIHSLDILRKRNRMIVSHSLMSMVHFQP
jgi:GTPase-activating protein that regulates ARFs (ADP-ribosylation factors), involved in ARF-mediated vesicular transport